MQSSLALPGSSLTPAETSLLVRFVLLSMLLHLLVVVLLGTAASNGSRRGDGFLSSLDVTLRGLTPEAGSGADLAPRANMSPLGQTLLRQPRAARDSQGVPPPVDGSSDVSPATQPSAIDAPPRLAPAAPDQVDKPAVPSVIPPLKIEREPTPPVELRPRVAPLAPAAPIERITPPKPERELAPPVQLRPREVPLAPSVRIERIAPPPLERELTPPVQLPPREAPVAPAAPIERVAPPQIERELASPVQLPPREAPVAPAAPIERVAPPQIGRELAPPVEVPARRQVPLETGAPPAPVPGMERETAPTATPSPGNAPEQSAPPADAMPPATAPGRPPATQQPASPGPVDLESLPRLRFGTTTPEQEVFRPRGDVVPLASEPVSPPYLDLQGARKAAVEDALQRSGSRGLVQLQIAPPEREPKEIHPLEKAVKPDCRTAYASLGLLAIPALMASAIADTGCRW